MDITGMIDVFWISSVWGLHECIYMKQFIKVYNLDLYALCIPLNGFCILF